MDAGGPREQFRFANTRLLAALGGADLDAEVPFICECDDPTCFDRVPMTVEDFERMRDEGGFAVVRGHPLDATVGHERRSA